MHIPSVQCRTRERKRNQREPDWWYTNMWRHKQTNVKISVCLLPICNIQSIGSSIGICFFSKVMIFNNCVIMIINIVIAILPQESTGKKRLHVLMVCSNVVKSNEKLSDSAWQPALEVAKSWVRSGQVRSETKKARGNGQ